MSQKARSVKNSQNNNMDVLNTTQEHDKNNELVNKCLRYILTKMGSNVPIKKSDIMKNALCGVPHTNYENTITRTKEVLRDVYGLNLEAVDSDSTKKYIVSNALCTLEAVDFEQDRDFKEIIRFLTLTHIFMSKNAATDLSLWKFLSEFNITPDIKIDESVTVQTFITKTLVKQQYICHETRGGAHADGQLKLKYMWGAHAEQSVSKMNVLKFVCSMYDNAEIGSWKDQYEDALQQQEDYQISA